MSWEAMDAAGIEGAVANRMGPPSRVLLRKREARGKAARPAIRKFGKRGVMVEVSLERPRTRNGTGSEAEAASPGR